MLEVPDFIQKAQQIYGYQNFINDAGGSLCELDSPQVMQVLAKHTLVIYIQASEHDEHELIKRAEKAPKPLYYREEFLDQQLAEYMQERKLEYCALIEPDDFVRWIFPRLFYARIPRYEAIAKEYGYTITTDELSKVSDEEDFLTLISSVLDR